VLNFVHHIAIICSDYERSKYFYREVLGLTLVHEAYRPDRESWKCDFALGSLQIELFSFPNPPPRASQPEACGLRHLAFSVTALRPAIERLTSFGVIVEPIRTDPHTGRFYTFFMDPDGLPLELYEWTRHYVNSPSASSKSLARPTD
jgi:glyoxylase I family protein